MVHASELLAAFEAQYAREAYRGLSYDQALAWFAAAWGEAAALNPRLGEDWLEDLASDRAMARALNGLPPEH